jgi:ribosomal-protein-alanine N-acetyltransferase
MEGIFVSPPDPPGVAWIKSFACRKQLESYQIFKSLLEQALNLLPIGTLQLLAIGLQDWFIKLLTMNDFRLIQKVVVLKHKQVFSKSLINPSVFIRPMQLDDITAVAEVDQTSFEPIWTVSSQGLKAAFFQSARASVAEMGGKIIGYELSTANSFSAHLARIAVLPEFQKEKIGFQLVHAMIEFFYKMGIRDITVNTQDSNHASISLYQKAGFQMTGDQIPVFQYKPTLNTGQ